MDVVIREMHQSEYPLLREFIYEAIFQRDLLDSVPKTIVDDPTVYVYIDEFGSREHDYCLCADAGGNLVGAVWVRIINGFGHVDEKTPEFAISLYKEYRGQGIGTRLMQKMLAYLKSAGYEKTSLAVQKDNYAYKMYQNVGFVVAYENSGEYIMVHNLL